MIILPPVFDGLTDLAPATDRLDALVPAVATALRQWQGPAAASEIIHAMTDPEWADTATFVEHYGGGLLEVSANCVVAAAKRGGETRYAACLIPSATRADLNGAARKALDARKVSFAPLSVVVETTGMEYGGVTPIGLPPHWPLLLDPSLLAIPHVLVGSGSRAGKLILPSKSLLDLPGATPVPALAT
ncbi:YbaK/EbsC family protein [Streptomyces sp. NPDC048606]|uniref:YbaK/EbsC family protein n=1 Tax=Streptomyces sp. NPDC048606 TaxID=3154726 RepID=UPI003439E992